jgi:hypothetical protein
MKVVINSCYGGFSLSQEGVMRYAEIKGITLYPEVDPKWKSMKLVTYWTCPPEERTGILPDEKFYEASMEERQASNNAYGSLTLNDRDIARDDPVLVQVVEEMGADANGRCADLRVVEIPDDVEWEIEEYDGKEWVAEVHRTWY